MGRTKALLAPGDRVRLAGLTAAGLNGKLGTMVAYHRDKQRYEIEVDGAPGSKAVKECNLEMLPPSPQGSATPRVHILVPCHIASPRRLVTFMRCAKSVAHQTVGGFCVFVGLSGPEEHRENATSYLTLLASKCPHSRWYLQDDAVEVRAQFEHLRHLLALSDQERAEVWLMFVDNDDMMHPRRVEVFKEIIQDPTRPEGPFNVPCKLLLDDTLSPDEGTIDRLISHSQDFFKWRSDEVLRRKLSVAGAENVVALDAEEYFDWCVPASILRNFMELTPLEITGSPWCDLRFMAALEHLCVLEPMDVNLPWLLAHYKTPLDAKKTAFDNAGRLQGLHTPDQASMMVHPTAHDAELAATYGSLQPGQVAMLRGRIESQVIQFCVWCPEKAASVRRKAVGELDAVHPKGLGDELWECATATFEGAFSRAQNERNKAWWQEAQGALENYRPSS